MPALILYSEYSRQDVHDIFSPDTRFTQSAGTWGLQGIVEIPNKPGNFIFFVTFGQHQADHTFDEWITEEGVISWQSQPKQSLEDRKIQQFIHHDDKKNSIHLFLRTQRTANYSYLGKLIYKAHDPAREKPVYMYWQLMDWPIPAEALERINIQLQSANIFRQVMEPGAESGNGNNSIIWHGKTWQANRPALISQVRDWIVRGLPEEAIRFRDWYVDIDGQHISPKWLFHLITGAGYNEFDAPTARQKLSICGLVAVRVRKDDESDAADQEEVGSMNSDRLKPAERQIVFEKISQELSKESPDIFRLARFRFPDRENWFEIHFPNLRGYYSLRLARRFDEFAYFLPGDIQAAEALAQQIAPQLKMLSEQMEYPVTVEPSYWQSWNRFGFEMPNGLVIDRDGQESIEIAYARKLGCFIKATYFQLVALLSRRASVQSVEKSGPIKGSQPQIQILSTRLDSIRQVLSGSATIPSDEMLCEWVHFCYDFELYREGQLLFELVSSEQVNPWYYERTKKLARLCSMRIIAKD
jgi:hypothetical protein